MLSENLRKSRLEKELSQQEVADLVGVTQVMIHRYENGTKTPTIPVFVELSRVLGKSMDELAK